MMTSSHESISLNDALTDIEARFLLNLPEDELSKVDRLLFWIQEAHWFYDDFYCDNYSSLPRYTFKQFTKEIFNHCPLFAGMANNVDNILSYYRQYKSKIPVCGCILLTANNSKLLLVCNWNGKSWTFPRGKVNENEENIDCAIREVYEETGFDISSYIDRDELHMIESDDGNIKLFIVSDIPEDTYFEAKTRKEISDIKFFPINGLPSDNFAVKQFIKPLKQWISQQRHNNRRLSFDATSSAKSTYNKNVFNLDTFHGDSSKKWGVNEMFAANASLTGRNYDDYDGNPHAFGSQHPRYVDYNSIMRERHNTSSTLSDDFDLSLIAMQSSQFHVKRRSDDQSEQQDAGKLKPMNRSKSSSASDKLLSKLKKLSFSKEKLFQSQPALTSTSTAAGPRTALLPVPFRFNRELIMEAFDGAW
jgi:mRNA-decapping enzyme subunit 2